MPTEVMEDGDVVEDVSISRENSRENKTTMEEHLECCPICLLPYNKDGVSEIRTLSYAWFSDHTVFSLCHQNRFFLVWGRRSRMHHRPPPPLSVETCRDDNPRWRFHSHWNNTQLHTGADERRMRHHRPAASPQSVMPFGSHTILTLVGN